MLFYFLAGLHILVSAILILVVLLQTGKSADLAGAFGGGGSQTAFGSRGAANFLTKMTTASAVIFMVTSFSLAVLSARGQSSVLDQTGVPEGTSVPVPAPPTQPAPSTGAGLPSSSSESGEAQGQTGGAEQEEGDGPAGQPATPDPQGTDTPENG